MNDYSRRICQTAVSGADRNRRPLGLRSREIHIRQSSTSIKSILANRCDLAGQLCSYDPVTLSRPGNRIAKILVIVVHRSRTGDCQHAFAVQNPDKLIATGSSCNDRRRQLIVMPGGIGQETIISLMINIDPFPILFRSCVINVCQTGAGRKCTLVDHYRTEREPDFLKVAAAFKRISADARYPFMNHKLCQLPTILQKIISDTGDAFFYRNLSDYVSITVPGCSDAKNPIVSNRTASRDCQLIVFAHCPDGGCSALSGCKRRLPHCRVQQRIIFLPDIHRIPISLGSIIIDRFESRTRLKCPGADVRHADRDRNAHQICTVNESFCSYACHALRNHKLQQTCTGFKSILPDACYISRDCKTRQLIAI